MSSDADRPRPRDPSGRRDTSAPLDASGPRDPHPSAPQDQDPTSARDHDPATAREFETASRQLQSHRAPSVIWGDERDAVTAALRWSSTHAVAPTDPKTGPRSAAELSAATGPTITPEGIGADRALALFDEVLIPATRASGDPMNLAHIPAAPTRAAIAFDTAVSAANVFGGVWEYGAGAIHAENQVLAWLVSLLGWPESAGGVFVSGGTSGNLSALATARENASTRRGARPEGGWSLASARTAHSSNASSARLLDMGVVTVPVDEDGRMTGPALAAVLDVHPEVCAVVASGGTTNAGIVDDIAGIVAAAHDRGVWVHVDGAYGGAALLSPTARSLFAGIEQADSFVVDPHKWLFAPYDCCALLYRDPRLAAAAHAQHAAYLDEVDRHESNPADLAAHLSRRTRGLPLWYSLATHGTDRYRQAVERCLATAREVASAIREMDHLELLREPDLSVLLFRRPGWDQTAYQRWSQRLARAGVILCIPTRHEGETVLRLAFVNPETDPAAVIDVLRSTMSTRDGS